ncbi:MAG: NAD-binding protein, partial [Gemmatimonadetes bacterium]|nr:NAD-binding protein [Gemmatimonadota bacterium]
VYPRLTLPFRAEGGKGFTFVLLAAIAAGLFAEAIGLHMILGAYLAGLFFEERVAHPNLVKVVNDRAYGIAYSFLGPIFFISLGFSISFDISASSVAFIALLAVTVIAGQVLSAGGMALRIGMPWREALTVGVGMCGRAEMAFILAALALAQGVIGQETFTILIFTAFLLNLFTPLALKGCSILLEGRVAHGGDTQLGVFQIDKFNTPFFDESPAEGTLPAVEDAVVIYGYGPEVETLIEELASRHLPMVVIEEDEATARQLQTSADVQVVHAHLAALDLRPLTKAKALVANGSDDDNALFALSAREAGFAGPIVAMIEHPQRRGPMLLAGATAAFTPNHVLAAAIAVRASAKIGPRVAGVESLDSFLEVAELRVHDQSPLANRTLAETELYTRTGAHIVGQWADDALGSPPAAAEKLEPGTILVAVGTPGSIHRLNDMSRPITQQGPIAVIGFADVGQKLVEILHAAGEEVRVVDEVERAGVDVVGDVLDVRVLDRATIAEARVVILALDSDRAALFAAAVVRNHIPEIPLLACVSHVENADRVQRAGADFALSVSQVAGQLLVHHVLGEMVSHKPRIKMVKLRPGPLAGRHPLAARIRERTGCSVVAVERAGDVIMEIPASLVLESEDALYVCGTPAAFDRYYEEFPT